jgi:FAD/FMN-containing dehydrogenase
MVSRRAFLATGVLAIAGCRRPGGEESDRRDPLWVNDVHSRLNATRVASIVAPTSLEDLQAAIRTAAAQKQTVCVAGGRHSMGGQQFARGAVLIDTRQLSRVLRLDGDRGLVDVEAGIQWPQLVDGLLAIQQGTRPSWSIRQKQTGADRMCLGGALSSNVHGRGLTMKPFIGDVESFVLVDAQGETRTCSRRENPDLFRLAIGGYGLFGVIYSVTLRLSPRRKVERVVELMNIEDLMPAFERRIKEGFLYGDFQFAIDETSPDYMRRGVFSCYRPVAPETPMEEVKRASEDDWLKMVQIAHKDKSRVYKLYTMAYLSTNGKVYWSDTHQLGAYVDDYHSKVDRALRAAHPATEIITEVYVQRPNLAEFMREVRADFRRNRVNLIYGTVRLIERDDESFLPWARDRFACIVFNLHTEHTPAGRDASAQAFRRLIDAGVKHGGSYYLTYHRFATREQVEKCYPMFRDFLAQKHRHDPEGRFQSEWYRHYKQMFGPV